jgi:hypothetical protein
MPKAIHCAKMDDELRRQCEDPVGPVEAVFELKPADQSQSFLEPEETERLTKAVLQRVGKLTSDEPQHVHVFRNLGRFVVSAEPQFLKALLAQPEISSAKANQRPGSDSLMIRPRNVKPA